MEALAIAMPDQTAQALSYVAGILFVFYLGFVITTITLATLQTTLSAEVRETEGLIAELERTYYDALAREHMTHPSDVGLTTPTVVEYAVERSSPSVTFAR